MPKHQDVSFDERREGKYTAEDGEKRHRDLRLGPRFAVTPAGTRLLDIDWRLVQTAKYS